MGRWTSYRTRLCLSIATGSIEIEKIGPGEDVR
jgi:hypothetical protein